MKENEGVVLIAKGSIPTKYDGSGELSGRSHKQIFEIALLSLGAVLIAALGVILWWQMAGDMVKALIAGWLALPLYWKIVLPVVFGALAHLRCLKETMIKRVKSLRWRVSYTRGG